MFSLQKQFVAFVLVSLFAVNPLVAASATPTVTKEAVALSNALDLVPPTNGAAMIKSTLKARIAITKNWTTWVNTSSSKLAEVQSQLIANRSALIANQPDATPLYNSLRAAGSDLTLKQVQSLSASSSARREAILNTIESNGLASVLGGLTNNKNPFTVDGPQPQEDPCGFMAEGNDIVALAALIAFTTGQVEIAAAMAAVGAAEYLYGEYGGCETDYGDGGFFSMEGD